MLHNIFEYFKAKNELLLGYAILCFVAGLNAWTKPLKFFISFGVFAFTMALYIVYLHNQR